MLPPDDPWEIFDDVPYIPKRERAKVPFRPNLPPVRIKWTLEIQGSLIHLKRHVLDPLPPEHHPKKTCHILSRESRMNLLRMMNRIDWDRVGRSTFVTLTYPPGHVQWKYKKRSMDRYQFMRAWETEVGKPLASLWKVEWKRRKRGADRGQWVPHLHLAVMDTPWINIHFLRRKWRSLIDYPIGPLSTKIKEITTKDGLARYLAKYISKSSPLDISGQLNKEATIGRAWGVTRPELIPWSDVTLDAEIEPEAAAYLRRLFAERQEWFDPSIHGGFTWFGKEDAKILANIIENRLYFADKGL